MAIANVALTDTFDYWRTVTNSLVTGMNDKLVYFSTANANSVTISSNVYRQGTVYINVVPSSYTTDTSTSNIASSYAVNTVMNYAVALSGYANGINTNVVAAFSKTNSTLVLAQAAFVQANAFSIVVGNTAPTGVQGSVWWHNELGKLFVYYRDGDTDQWIDTAPAYDVNFFFSEVFDWANTINISTTSAYSLTNTVNTIAVAAFAKANGSSGATGGGADSLFYLGDTTITTNYSIPTNKNAMTPGPITLNSGVTVTVNTGST